jgi:hypothetical protein
MAIRNKLTHDQKTRERIQTSQIVNRLEKHVFGENEMTATQVNAAKILLSKTIPDLKQIEASIELTTHEQALSELE